MRLLLDTHTLIWWLFDDPKLPTTSRRMIADPGNEILISSGSAWEIATKRRRGKLPGAGDLADRFEHYLSASRFTSLPVTVAHALAAGRLPGPHKDPFDRLLIAQCRLEDLAIVTADPISSDYGTPVIWR